jgi:hypothetical protein
MEMAVLIEATLKRLRSSRKNRSFLTAKALLAYLALGGLATLSTLAQDTPGYVFHPNQKVQVSNLPARTAQSNNPSAVLAAVLETILQDKAVCCGKNSALEDTVLSTPMSLRELSARLQGKHVVSDGRSVMVSAEYVPQSSITPDLMISSLMDQHALLMNWNSHFYVLYGAVFDETVYDSGQRQFAIRKLLLLDPRFSDQRRDVEFNRESDDWGKVEGLLTLAVARQ